MALPKNECHFLFFYNCTTTVICDFLFIPIRIKRHKTPNYHSKYIKTPHIYIKNTITTIFFTLLYSLFIISTSKTYTIVTLFSVHLHNIQRMFVIFSHLLQDYRVFYWFCILYLMWDKKRQSSNYSLSGLPRERKHIKIMLFFLTFSACHIALLFVILFYLTNHSR